MLFLFLFFSFEFLLFLGLRPFLDDADILHV